MISSLLTRCALRKNGYVPFTENTGEGGGSLDVESRIAGEVDGVAVDELRFVGDDRFLGANPLDGESRVQSIGVGRYLAGNCGPKNMPAIIFIGEKNGEAGPK